MNQHQHLGIVGAAKGDTFEIADAKLDGHPHAVDRTVQHDAFAMKFDLPHAAVRTGVVRAEADGQGKGVEPQCTARPGGIDPACCCLTPHGLVSPPGLCSRSIRETLAGLSPVSP